MGNPATLLYEGEQPADLAGFLDSAQAELSYDIHPTPLHSLWCTESHMTYLAPSGVLRR
jgi:hypothetical protein